MSGVQTYWAKIFLGMRIGYTRRQFSYRQVEGTVRYHVTRYPTCVTMTRTKFAYKDGWDRGLVIGLINYPRFPSAPEKNTHLCAFNGRVFCAICTHRIE